MTANMAASAITVVSMSAFERLVAISCPWSKINKEDKNYNNLLSKQQRKFPWFFSSKNLKCYYHTLVCLLCLSYLAEGSTLCHDDMKLAFSSSVFEEGLNRARTANSHDDLIRVNVLQGLHCNIVSCSLWKRKQ